MLFILGVQYFPNMILTFMREKERLLCANFINPSTVWSSSFTAGISDCDHTYAEQRERDKTYSNLIHLSNHLSVYPSLLLACLFIPSSVCPFIHLFILTRFKSS